MKKYLCIGGNVYNKYDGSIHHILSEKLPKFYQVNPRECYFADDDDDPIIKGLKYEELIILRPRNDGIYHLEAL